MAELSTPSVWSRQRFGEAARPLRRAIPAALAEAHRRALTAHVGSELTKTTRAYGMPLADIQHEVMVQYAGAVEGARMVHPRHSQYELVVVNSVVLYPWKYATDGTRVQDARLARPVSDVRRNLLGFGDPTPSGALTFEQADLDEDELQAQWEAERAVLEELADSARVVTIPYASNPKAGILWAGWGDAELVDPQRGQLHWHHLEPLPPADPSYHADGRTTPRTPVPPVPDPAAGRRFDDAPLVEPQIGPQPPLTQPANEPGPPRPETGSDGTR
jgi:hypothetical protein